MSRQRIEKTGTQECVSKRKLMDTQDDENPGNLSTKLERRRRIEDLNEARRLRDEQEVF